MEQCGRGGEGSQYPDGSDSSRIELIEETATGSTTPAIPISNADTGNDSKAKSDSSIPPQSLADQMLRYLPEGIMTIEGALIFAGGQVFFFNQDTRKHEQHFKCLSSQVLRIAFSRETIDSGWFPPGIVKCGFNSAGHSWFVKFIPPTVVHRLVFVDLERILDYAPPHLLLTGLDDQGPTLTGVADQTEILEQSNIPMRPAKTKQLVLENVTLPGLIFAGCGPNYYLWATDEREFKPSSLCYSAPLPNVYDTGRICWGDNQVQNATPQYADTAWSIFINSPFNSHLANSKSRKHSDDVRKQLLALQKTDQSASATSGSANSTTTQNTTAQNTTNFYPAEDLLYFNSFYRRTIEETVANFVSKPIAAEYLNN
jgi:hypothetical protein